MIEIAHLHKFYPRRKQPPLHAVADLTLSIPAGQLIGLLGTNGAGKTTTIKMICGLITPDSGTMTVNGYSVPKQRSLAMRQIGAVLEGTRNIYWRMTAWQNLLYFGRMRLGQNLPDRADFWLHEMGLTAWKHEEVGKFSRGMQQKLAIAAALMADPPILLLDEPTLGLDVQAARNIKTLLRKPVTEQGKTIVLTTHQLDIAQEVCERIAIIKQGRLIADHPTAELLGLFRQEYYEIRVRGQITEAIPGFTVQAEHQDTLLHGAITDQTALYALLNRLHEFNLPLISVNRVEPNLEEVFIKMVEQA